MRFIPWNSIGVQAILLFKEAFDLGIVYRPG
jgi:hypothetical protein